MLKKNNLILLLMTTIVFVGGPSIGVQEPLETVSSVATTSDLFNNQTLWTGLDTTFNTSIDVNNGGNLTIVNSFINFTYEEVGFLLNNNSFLKIVDSTITGGGVEGIDGETNGTLILENVTFSDFLDDMVKLKGNYQTSIDNCTFVDGNSDGIQLESSDYQANVTNSVFKHISKDGLKGEKMPLYLENLIFEDCGDEAIQLAKNDYVTAVNIDIDTVGDTGLEAEEMKGLVHVKYFSVTNAVEDCLQVNIGEDVLAEHVYLSNCGENAFETGDTAVVTLNNVTMKDSDVHGLEAINVDEVHVTGSHSSGMVKNGFYVENVTSFQLQGSTIKDNTNSGVELVGVNSSTLTHNKFTGNSLYDVEATEIGTGNSVNASFNYWGTLVASEVSVTGEVMIDPILDADLESIQTETSDATSSEATTSGTDTESTAPSFIAATVLISLVLSTQLVSRKRRK